MREECFFWGKKRKEKKKKSKMKTRKSAQNELYSQASERALSMKIDLGIYTYSDNGHVLSRFMRISREKKKIKGTTTD